MKKILLIILLFIIGIGVVKAGEIESITLKWQETTTKFKEVRKIGNYDYIFAEKEILKINPKKTKDVKRYTFEGYYHFYLEEDKIYVYSYSYTDEKYHFIILDLDLNKVKEGIFSMGTPDYYSYENHKYIFMEGYYRSVSYVELNDDLEVIEEKHFNSPKRIFYIGKDEETNTYYFKEDSCTSSNCSYYKLDETYTEISSSAVPNNLNRYSFFDFLHEKNNVNNGNNVSEETYNAIISKVEPEYDDTEMVAQIEKDGNNYVVLFREEKHAWYDNDPYILYTKTLMYLDSDLNEKWRIEYPAVTLEGALCGSNGTGNYLMVNNGNIFFATNETEEPVAKIYDRDKNELLDLVELLNLDFDNVPTYAEYTETGIMIIYEKYQNTCAFTSSNANKKVLPSYLTNVEFLQQESAVESSTIIYYLDINYYIHTKVLSGEGTIKVNKTMLDSDEVVEFEVLPKEGYVLGEVKVIDAEGNVITFKDYKFTMPSSDVTIEVKFVAANPNTKAFISYIIIVIGGIAGMSFYLLSQRKKLIK